MFCLYGHARVARRQEKEVKNNKGVRRNLVPKRKKMVQLHKSQKVTEDSSSESDASLDNVISNSSDDLEDFETISNNEEFEIGNFVLVKFPTKLLVIHYIGRISEINSPSLTIKFMRRKGLGHTFLFPTVDDIIEVDVYRMLLQS
ncbi:hypothetical protein JTB14_002829 [Gonioctena quinquepunctata]|nr:hypothetical protein JTB14_002829 [Gonioctena quinquepunctata]